MIWLAFRNFSFGVARIDVVLSMLAVLASLWQLYWADRVGGLKPAVFVWFASLFLSVGLAVGGLTGREWSSCSAEFDKCSIAGHLYTGIFGSENVLGEVALCLLLTVQIPRYERKWFHLATFGVLLLIAGSRTPLVSFVSGRCSRWRCPAITARRRPDGGVLYHQLGRS